MNEEKQAPRMLTAILPLKLDEHDAVKPAAEEIKPQYLERNFNLVTFKSLKDLCVELQLNSYDLEGLVCDISPRNAAAINRRGIQAQVGFLVSQLPYDYIEHELRSIVRNS